MGRARHATLALLLAVAACNGVTRPCKKGTVLASVTFDGATADADTLDVTVAIDGGMPVLTNIDHVPGAATGTIEITFPSGYPMGHEIRVAIVARNAGRAVATTADSVTLDHSCATLMLTVGAPTGGGAVDLGTCAPTCSGVVCGEVSGCSCGTCALHAIEVPTAQRGDTLRLEGRFAAGDAMVRFGDGTMVTATQIAPGRLQVVVPDAPASGPVAVMTGGQTTNTLPLRVVAFDPKLGTFSTRYEQTDAARVLPSWRARAAIVTDDSLLVARRDGGLYRERINADGTVDALGKPPVAVLTTDTNKTVYGAVRAGAHLYALVDRDVVRVALTSQHATGAAEATGSAVARSGPALAVVGTFLYALGGRDANGATTTVERAEIFGDGTLGAFADAGVALLAPREEHRALVIKDNLYVFTGNNDLTASQIERAPIGGDGKLGAFVDAGAALTRAQAGAGIVALGHRLYALGGSITGGASSTTILAATIKDDGTLTAFADAGVPLSAGQQHAVPAVVGNWLYLIGGDATNGSGQLITPPPVTDRAPIGGAALGAFADSGVKILTQRRLPRLIALGSSLWVIGGVGTFNGMPTMPTPYIDVAAVDPSGNVGTFKPAVNGGLVNGRDGSVLAVIGNYLYVVGGNTTPIERAPIDDLGQLGAFANIGTAPNNMVGAVGCLTEEALHVANNTTTNAFSGVVQADGSISFTNESSALTARVFAATAAVRDGWYVIGGGAQVEHAAVTRGMATLPAFAADGGLPASRTFTTGARVGNLLLVMGGQVASADSGTLDVATIAANGTLGTWTTSTTTTLPMPLTAPAAIALGDWLYAIGGRISATFTYVDTVSRAPIK